MKNLSVKVKKEALVKVALFYPNKLKIAAANLGYLTIYDILNGREDTLCELFTMDEKYVSRSYDSGRDISDFGIIAVSMPFEMDIFNLIRFFKLNGIPLYTGKRNKFHPLIVGGGAYFTLNPEAIAEFFDAILIGEGEEAVGDLIENFLKCENKNEVKERLAEIEGYYIPDRYETEYDGVYVKSRQGIPKTIKKRLVKNIDEYIPSSLDDTPPSHFKDTFLVEVSRGCPYSCAFCSTPSLYNPYRYREPDGVISKINEHSSYGKVGFVGSAISDYPYLGRLIDETEIKTITLSSFRINRVDEEIILSLKKRGLKTVTIASEAGNERMWRKIGKGIREKTVFDAVDTLSRCGIERMKIYFIIGFRFETDDDVYDIAMLLNKIAVQYSGHITASVNIFIPKPQSILQWAPLADKKLIKRRVAILRKNTNRSVQIDMLSYKTAVLETIFSRGNRCITDYIVKSENDNIFNLISKNEKYFSEFLGELDIGKMLPWDFIEGGIEKKELKRRYLSI